MNKKFYNEVGIEIKRFAKKNFRTQKGLADALNISESLLSKYINGEPEMPAKVVTQLCDKLGFPKANFIRYYSLEEIAPEVLGKDEMIRVVYEYQILLKQKTEYIDDLQSRVNAFLKSAADITKELNDLVSENRKLKMQLQFIEDEKRREFLEGKKIKS